jgi:hypothetical protein
MIGGGVLVVGFGVRTGAQLVRDFCNFGNFTVKFSVRKFRFLVFS